MTEHEVLCNCRSSFSSKGFGGLGILQMLQNWMIKIYCKKFAPLMYWVTEKKNPKNPTPNLRALTRLVVLYLQNYTTVICRHYRMQKSSPKKSLVKLSHLKKYSPHFLPQKPGNRKILLSTPLLEIQSTCSLPGYILLRHLYVIMCQVDSIKLPVGVYLTLEALTSTYKFSKLISIHFYKELVKRIW